MVNIDIPKSLRSFHPMIERAFLTEGKEHQISYVVKDEARKFKNKLVKAAKDSNLISLTGILFTKDDFSLEKLDHVDDYTVFALQKLGASKDMRDFEKNLKTSVMEFVADFKMAAVQVKGAIDKDHGFSFVTEKQPRLFNSGEAVEKLVKLQSVCDSVRTEINKAGKSI